MQTVLRWGGWSPVFWTLWCIELAVLLWLLWDELKLTYVPMNPWIFVGFLWLIAALIARLAGWTVVAAVLVIIPGVPLAIMAFFLLVVLIISLVAGPIRWN